jgi:hypothetical protein
MKIDRQTLLVLAAAFAIGYWLAGQPDNHTPRPSDRPVLTWIARAAKSMLWIAVFAEPPPAAAADTRTVQHAIGADGYPVVDHSRGL